MPIKAKELSAIAVKRLSDVGYHAVGGVAGLHLQISSTGAKSWIYRYTTGEIKISANGKPFKKRRDLGLGGYPDVTLEQARNKAREAKEKIEKGVDPIQERQARKSALLASQGKVKTFDECAIAVHKNKKVGFKNPKHADQWINTLKSYASPIIGRLSVADITKHHIVEILRPIWVDKPETAKRVRQRIEAVFDYATAMELRTKDNPARLKGNLDTLLPTTKAKVKSQPALPYKDIGRFVDSLRNIDTPIALGLELLILTATRSGDVRGARWEEVDLVEKVWTIPGDRMKAGKTHRVPLSDRCLEILNAMEPKDSGLIFTTVVKGQTRALHENSFTNVIKDMHETEIKNDRDGFFDPRELDADGNPQRIVAHGFRSTFRDWCAEATSYPNEVAEQALAHTISNAVEAAYRRGDMMEKRRAMMRDWASYVDIKNKPAKVRSIRSAKRG